jgi:hypothetical protein
MGTRMTREMRVEDRLKRLLDESAITESGCMEPNIAYHKNGYPYLLVDRKAQKVSRLLMPFLMANPVDITGLEVRHTCHNPRCINPEHLLLGTHAENMKDMSDAGRSSKDGRPGESNPRHVLDWEQVFEIRGLYATGQYSQYTIARRYGIARSTVAQIISNRSWKES